MARTTGILLILVSLSLGGLQLVFTVGKHLARQHARKVQRLRTREAFKLEHLSFDAEKYAAMDLEEVGNGVLEFEYQGYKYDAFEVTRVGSTVKLLVIKDHLDTWLHKIYKPVKRYLRNKSTQFRYSIFNFYFTSLAQPLLDMMREAEIQFKTWSSSYFSLTLEVDFPPPRN